ncbi:MAG: Rieske 2Fe-2S domain-containing protein [Pseudomonadota bacterium]
MGHQYISVQWNRNKWRYDLALLIAVIGFVVMFNVVASATHSGPNALSPEIVMIRALGACAFVMLTIVLCIGPAARLSGVFLPLLYNRRHFGVFTFVVALAHGLFSLAWYHGFGVIDPISSLFGINPAYGSFSRFPFQTLGAGALIILFLLAATSHDYWNTNLGAPFWKTLHMLVYLAYGLIVVHVAMGAAAGAFSGFRPTMVIAGAALVSLFHLAAMAKSLSARKVDGDWLNAGPWAEIADGTAVILTPPSGDRIAVFRYDGNKIAAVANACKHQNGPLGEGRVIDGCITCPWHGFQYRPEDGASPAPYTEKIATYHARLNGDRVEVDPNPLPPGTPRAVLSLPQAALVPSPTEPGDAGEVTS